MGSLDNNGSNLAPHSGYDVSHFLPVFVALFVFLSFYFCSGVYVFLSLCESSPELCCKPVSDGRKERKEAPIKD